MAVPPERPGEPGGPGEPEEPTFEEIDLEPPAPVRRGTPSWLKPVAAVAVIGVAAAAVLAYRNHHRRKVLAGGMAKAQALLRADTWAGYRDASRLLEPLAKLDPLEAGALRAYALSMLFADYRESKAGEEAEALLVEPGRASQVPEAAHLAYVALALGRQEVGNAAGFAARARSPAALTLFARTALLAGNLKAAAEPLAQATEVDPTLPAALALRGDVQRRSGQFAEARRSYLDALAASPNHPRAAYGLAKLALAGGADPAQAGEPLQRLAGDREGTPAPERARAALHLASLRGRGGDRAGAAAAIEGVGLDPASRAWAERAAADQAALAGAYRVAAAAPASLLSASDDDPYVAPPPAPPKLQAAPRPAPKVVAKKAGKKAKVAAAKAKKKAPAKKASAKKKPAKKAVAKKPAPKKPAPKPPPE